MEIIKTFASGLTLVAKHMPTMYTVSAGIYINVGSVREDASNNGYSHFLEHLMFKGTTNRSYTVISEEMDDIGAQLNAFTSKDNTCYYTKSSSQDIAKCLDLLSDLYFNSTFDSVEIDKEKSVVLEEISTNNDNPEDVAQDMIIDAMFHNQKLAQTILGDAEVIKNSTRDSLLDYRSRYYTPANTVVAIAGNFDCDNLVTLVEQYFENNYSANYPTIECEQTAQPTSVHLHCFKDIEQSHIALGYNGVTLDSDELYVFSLMANILGGGMSSRLFQVIREQHGLAYSVYSYPSVYKNNGFLEIYCGTSASNLDNLCALLEKVIADFVDNGITEKELLRAKAQMRNGLFMSLESTLSTMMALGRRMLKTGKWLDIDERVSLIDRVTVADINSMIVKTFAQPHASVYVGREVDNHQQIATIYNK